MEPLIDVTITADDGEWLEQFSRELVEDRLIACANIVPGVTSVYRWAGEVSVDEEYLAILHTRASLQGELVDRILDGHAYDEPQIIVLPVLAASTGYHRWVIESTGGLGA